MSGLIYELLVDDDGLVGVKKFELLSEYVERCEGWIGLFCSEFEYLIEDRIDVSEGVERVCGDEEEEKFLKESKRLNDLMERGKGWKVLSYSLECDVCYVVMKEKKIEEFLRRCKELVG